MGLTNVIKMLAMACPPSVRPAKPSAVPPAPAPALTTQVSVVDGHRHWLDGLSLHDRLRYDRAFGHAWFAGNGKEQCQAIARKAIGGSRHVGAGSNISREAEQPSEHAPAGHQSSNVKPGKVGKMSNCDVNGSFPTTYAEDRDGNSRASSFCLLRPRTRRQVPQK
jgi:hypothetical protein